MINNVLEQKLLPVYSDGSNRRDWIYVEDNCEAIYRVMTKGKPGEIYNIGTGKTEKNINIVNKICKLLSVKTKRPLTEITGLITYVNDRPAHDYRYCMNTFKLNSELHWTAKTDINKGLEKTVDWYLNNQDWVKAVFTKEYSKYYNANYSKR